MVWYHPPGFDVQFEKQRIGHPPFFFAGAQGSKGRAEGFAGPIVEYDTTTGWSGGGLVEAGTKDVGAGVIAGPAGAQGLVYLPVAEAGSGEAGAVVFTGGARVYGEVGKGPLAVGGGVYLGITNAEACSERTP
jgi:hypothetical protein